LDVKNDRVYIWLKKNYCLISETDIVSVTVFLSQVSDQNIEDFKDIPVLLADGRRMSLSEVRSLPGIQALVTPESLDPETGWQNIFLKKEDKEHFAVLSDEYIQDDLKNTNSIFKLIKPEAYPKFRSIKIKPYGENDNYGFNISSRLDSREIELVEKARSMSAEKRRNEIVCYSFATPTIFNEQINGRLSKALTKWLKNNHRFSNRDYYLFEIGLKMKVEYPYRGKNSLYSSSGTLYFLIESPWLFTSKGFVRPNRSFLPLPPIKEVLGDSVPYVEDDLSDNIIKLLGIHDEVTAVELISVLKQHAKNEETAKEFTERVYRYLNSLDLSKGIIDCFRQNKLIFVQKDEGSCWLSTKDVIWKDRKDILGNDFNFLEKIYPKLKDFFVETLGIKEDVDTEIFARRWLNLQNESDRNPEEIESILTNIYREIRPIYEMNKEDRPGWWQEFIDNAKIWTQAKVFESRFLVYIPDDGDLKKIFDGNDHMYAWRPEKDSFSDWESLYRAFDIKYLSDSVSISLSENLEYDIKSQNDFLTIPAKILILAWIRQIRPADYKRLLHEHVIETFLKTNEGTGSTWKVIYHLGDKQVQKERDVVWYKDNNILLITKGGNGRKKNKVALTLARDLMPNRKYKDLADWIELVLSETDWEWRIKQKGWHVPDEVKKWTVTQDDEFSEDIPLLESDDSTVSGSSKGNETSIRDDKIGDETDKNQQGAKQKSSSAPKKIEGKPPDKSKHSLTTDPVESEQNANVFNYEEEFIGVFNRSGKVAIVEIEESDSGIVSDPERRRDKESEGHQDRIENEPEPQKRRKKTERTILEGPDEQVRMTLGEWYRGKCQICGDSFPERDGQPFFIANYMVPRKFARQVDTYANALCMCAEHFAKWQHGAVEADDIVDQIRSMKTKAEGGAENLQVRIKLCGDECVIKFNEKHLIALQELLNADYTDDLLDL